MWRRDDSRRSQRGVALVEFALVLPLLIVLLFSVWELGRIFDAWLVVTNAAREGARYAVAGESDVKGKVMAYIASSSRRFEFEDEADPYPDVNGDAHIYWNDKKYFKVDRPGSSGPVTVTLRARVDIFAPLPRVGALRNPFTVTGRAVMRQ